MHARIAYSENKKIFNGKDMENYKLVKLPSFISSQIYLQIRLIFLLEMNSQNISVPIDILGVHATEINPNHFEKNWKFIKKR